MLQNHCAKPSLTVMMTPSKEKIIGIILMKKLLILLMVFTLSSCSLFRVHKMDIEQGNVMTPDMVAQLHPGMSESQVKSIMGTPMLTNTFSGGRIDYVYSFKPG